MANHSAPISQIIRNQEKCEEEPKKKTREDWRKAKELEEARKAGTAPAAVDEEGRDINPHIPQYISTAPWYYSAEGPTLKHQRPQPEKQREFSALSEWYNRGVTGRVATRFRKGACENCGAMGHKKKDCLERPRKVGAKYTGSDIAPDEHEQPQLSMDYDGKRDRWNGYDPSDHQSIVEEFQKVEDAKRELKAERLKTSNGDDKEDEEDDSDRDEDKYVEEADMPGTKVDSKQRITVRNLRIREDTAKYLRNLDPNSAYYDPKTRSMRDNPYANTSRNGNSEEVAYAGENFVRFTGDTQNHAQAQLFAWDAYERGVEVNLQAEPTKLEMLKHEYEQKKVDLKGNLHQGLLERYGGAEHLDAPPKQLLLAQSEDYVEYSRQGKVVKGQEKKEVSSKYEEDVYINNHTSVWGSFWRDGIWGYQCCHSFVKNSYCTGDSGKSVMSGNIIMASTLSDRESDSADEEPQKSLLEMHQEKRRGKRKEKQEPEDDGASKKKKLKDALRRQEEHEREVDSQMKVDERKRKYNSRYEIKAPTEEEVEAFQMRRQQADDPMNAFMK